MRTPPLNFPFVRADVSVDLQPIDEMRPFAPSGVPLAPSAWYSNVDVGQRAIAPAEVSLEPVYGSEGRSLYGPAGAVYNSAGALDSGVSAANQPAGASQFRASIEVVGIEPMFDSGRFEADLRACVAELLPQGAVLRSGSIRKGGVTMVNFSSWQTSVPSWWCEVTGTVETPSGYVLDNLARAVARAWGHITTYRATDSRWVRADGSNVPLDGAALHAAFRRANACTGGLDHTPGVIFGAACLRAEPLVTTRVVLTPPQGLDQPQAPVPTPGQPPAPTPGFILSTQPLQPISAPRVIRPVSVFWLRPRAVLTREGPQFPAGTEVTLIEDTSMRQGDNELWRIRVNSSGQTGFALFSPRDLGGSAPSTGGGSTPDRPPQGGARPESTMQTRPPEGLGPQLPREPEADRSWIWWMVAGVSLMAAGVASYKYRDNIRAWWSGDKMASARAAARARYADAQTYAAAQLQAARRGVSAYRSARAENALPATIQGQ